MHILVIRGEFLAPPIIAYFLHKIVENRIELDLIC